MDRINHLGAAWGQSDCVIGEDSSQFYRVEENGESVMIGDKYYLIGRRTDPKNQIGCQQHPKERTTEEPPYLFHTSPPRAHINDVRLAALCPSYYTFGICPCNPPVLG